MSITDYQPYLDFITSQHEHMMQLTHDWSSINTGSYNVGGINEFADVLADNFLWLHGEQERIKLKPMQSVDEKGNLTEVPLGDSLRIRKRPDAPLQIFLGGHMDTVFPKDCEFLAPWFKDNDAKSGVLHGPGVADLKGGLVVMLKALEALEQSPWAENIGWEVLLNPDEEIGSHGSAPLLVEAAKRCHLGLIYEPSLPDGTLVSARKGSGNFSLVVRGKTAHAGRDFDKGRNAIALLAEATTSIFNLNGIREKITINPGKLEGGGALNAVPDLAIMRFNVRVGDADDAAWMQENLDKIVAELNSREGFSAELHGGFTRPAKVMTPAIDRLRAEIENCGKDLGLSFGWKATGGCCDGNNLAAAGLPNIDTLGVRGANIHSDEEYMLTDSLVERAQLSALLLMKLASGEIEWTI